MTPQESAISISLKTSLLLMDFLPTESVKQASVSLSCFCLRQKYEGIVNVIADLKSRGEISEKIYLKCLNDLNEEKDQIIKQIQNL